MASWEWLPCVILCKRGARERIELHWLAFRIRSDAKSSSRLQGFYGERREEWEMRGECRFNAASTQPQWKVSICLWLQAEFRISLAQDCLKSCAVCGGGFYLPCEDFLKCSTIHSPPELFSSSSKVEIRLRTPIALFRPGSVHSSSASWDDCGRMFPDELRVISFLDRFPHSGPLQYLVKAPYLCKILKGNICQKQNIRERWTKDGIWWKHSSRFRWVKCSIWRKRNRHIYVRWMKCIWWKYNIPLRWMK